MSSSRISFRAGAATDAPEVPLDANAAKPLRLLLVEDSDEDALLVLRSLRRGGYEPTVLRVDSRDAFREALETGTWDIIISDHTVPGYGGLNALHDLQRIGKDVPFILVSGTIGEAVAVSAMKAGAQDYVLKGDLTRLPGAVERETRESALRAEQAKLRERLVLSERMASAGTLAAGVAHEINNPLAIAMVNLDTTAEALARIVELAQDLKARGSRAAATLCTRFGDVEEPLAEATEALQRIREIVRDVKLFSRPDDETTCTVDPRRVADSSIRMAWNEIRHRARLVKSYGDVTAVHANEARLGQVLLNLLVNAAHAVPEGRAESNEIRVITRNGANGWAIVEVTDTGSGISKEHIGHIFDPFFTTKPIGVGTGLGLAICHRIVTELGGRIEVESEIGKGSLFRVALPPARESPSALKAARPEPTKARARILVVDDEAALGRAIGRGLSPRHDVTLLTSGQQALDIVDAGERFDVILLDVMMPHLNGMDVHEHLVRTAPAQASRIVFMTGGAFTPAARDFLDRIPNRRMDKPIAMAGLLAMLEAVLRESSP